MSLNYRVAIPDDAAALSDFARDAFVETFGHIYPPADLAQFLAATYSPAQQYAEIIDPGSGHHLALDDAGRLAGFVKTGPMALPYAAGPGRAVELKRLYVRRDRQGSGAADALMDWALAWAQARFAAAIFLGVFAENHRAIAFYRRHDFEPVGRYHFRVGATLDDELILCRRL